MCQEVLSFNILGNWACGIKWSFWKYDYLRLVSVKLSSLLGKGFRFKLKSDTVGTHIYRSSGFEFTPFVVGLFVFWSHTLISNSWISLCLLHTFFQILCKSQKSWEWTITPASQRGPTKDHSNGRVQDVDNVQQFRVKGKIWMPLNDS